MANKDYNTLTAQELKDQAKARRIKNWWLLKKAELIEALTALDKVEEVAKAAEKAEKAEAKPTEKKAEKKAAPKKEKEVKNQDNIITLKELAVTYGIKGSKARRLLREAKVERPFKRWEWDQEEHHDILTQVKTLLGGGTEEE